MNCNKEKFKRLGDYIQEVDVRNRDLQCSNLLGLSIAKVFIPSIANTVGTDFRPYKIVKHNQFAYVPVTSRNGDKITVALYDGQEDCIISQAYTSFEVKDVNELLPEYLMMWFRRPEFDRYARFKSHGSAREVFDWEEMCNVMMPIPDPDEQQRIVDQYNAIQKRIENNKQTISKLENTAQAIYRKMFVDDIDPENLPDGWELKSVNELSKSVRGVTYSSGDLLLDKDEIIKNGILVIRGNNIENSQFVEDDNVAFIPKSLVTEDKYVRKGEIVMTMSSGSPAHIGKCFFAGRDLGCVYGAFLNKFVPNEGCEYLLFLHFISDIFKIQVKKNANGCGIDNLNLGHFDEIFIPFNQDQLECFNSSVAPLFKHIANLESENIANSKLLLLLNL